MGRDKYSRLLRLVLTLGLVAMLGGSAQVGSAGTGADVLRFAIIGDRTGDHVEGVYEQVLSEMMRLRPEFIINVGDMIEGYTTDTTLLKTQWAEYKQVLKPVTVPIHLVPGNHDILSDIQEQVYLKEIGDRYYSFDERGFHFVVLDVGRWEKSEQLPADQINWLIKDLSANSGAVQTFVFMHKPFWYNSLAVGKPDTLHNLFVRYGVDAVFTGHFHQYFSAEYDGIKYTSLGSSGGGADPSPPDLLYHFCWVTADADDITIAPIKMGAVLPWDEMTVNELRLISRMQKFTVELQPLLIGPDMKPIDGRLKLVIHNLCPTITLQDTLRWNVPSGWHVTPALAPVTVLPNETATLEFVAGCDGQLYPIPTMAMLIPYAEGKTTTVTAPLNAARTVTCSKAEPKPVIDGNIADRAWQNPVTNFFSPDGGNAAIEPVTFYFAYDKDNLYLAAKCTETKMDSLVARVVDHDGPVYTEDCVGLFIQPDRTKMTAYQIYLNPLGRAFDQKLTMNDDGYMNADREWNGRYQTLTSHGPDYWTIEAAIPWAELGVAGAPGKELGINFRRKQFRLGSSADWQAPIDYDPRTYGLLIME